MFTNVSAIGASLAGFVVALLGSLVLTFVVRERAKRAGLFDHTDARKLHTGEIPRIGGVAIFGAFAIALGVVAIISGTGVFGEKGDSLLVVLAGAVAVFLIGLRDDLKPMRARWKFLAQIGVSLLVFAAGLRVESLALPLVGILQFGPAVSLLFTVVWLVGITNAFNLIDGLDGLASGAALFALTTMFVVGTINGNMPVSIVTVALAGATLGFLFYNFNPASIFLGDSGSLFLGFMLAGLGLLSSQKSQTIVAVAIPVVSLGLPVLDTLLAITRRFLRGQPIFSADRGHIHHRLLNLGHSPRQVALIMYAACAMLALGGMLLVNNSEYVAVVLVVFGLGVGFAIQRLRFYEFEELARLFRKGVNQRQVIGKNVRIREASKELRGIDDLSLVFEALARTFTDDDFHRAEVRLRPSFLEGRTQAGRDRRFEDDRSVWSWNRSASSHPGLWEIKLPLLDTAGSRIGCLILWQDGMASETSLSHVHTIARELREVVQGKLLALWHSSAYERGVERVVPMSSSEMPIWRADERSPRGAEPTPATAQPAVTRAARLSVG